MSILRNPPKTLFVTMELERGEHTHINTQTSIERFKFDDEPVRTVYEYKLVKVRHVRRVLQDE